MCALIGFGRWSPYYYYILVSTVTKFLKEDILGLGSDFPIIYRLKITHHPLMVLLISFFSDLLIGAILILYSNYKNDNNTDHIDFPSSLLPEQKSENSTKEDILETDKGEEKVCINNIINYKEDIRNGSFSNKYYLIYNDVVETEIDIIKQNSVKFILISSFLIMTKEFFTKVAYSSNDIFDYYFLNLIIIVLMLRIVFKKKIYLHQKFAIIFVCIISGGCVIGCIFAISEENITYMNKSFSYTFRDKFYLIIVLIVAYIFISTAFCMGIIIQKNLMHVKFTSAQTFIFWKGLFGVVACIIGLIIATNVPCDSQAVRRGPPPERGRSGGPPGPGRPGPGPPQDRNVTELFEIFVCNDGYGEERFFDNFYSYFAHLTNKTDNKAGPQFRNDNITDNRRGGPPFEDYNFSIEVQIVIEVFIILGYFILHFISDITLVYINNFLSPVHYLITESLFNIFHLPCQMITKYAEDIKRKQQAIKIDDYLDDFNHVIKTDNTRILKLVAVVVEFLGYLIYLEIIHLNFCGLNRDTSINIQKRAQLDTANDDETSNASDYNINENNSD